MQDHGVAFNTRSPPPSAAVGVDQGLHCSVMEQKQTQSGFTDEPCGKPVPDDFAGLCEYVILHCYYYYYYYYYNRNYY